MTGQLAQTQFARRFVIPTNTFSYGRQYIFQVETWLQTNAGTRTSDTVTVRLKPR